MTRVMVVAAVLLAASVAHAGGPRCKKVTPALQKKEAAARAYSDKQFAAAIAALGLTPVQLRQLQVAEEGFGFGMHSATRPIGEVFQQDGKTLLAGPVYFQGQQGAERFELVRNAEGDIVHLVRAPEVKSPQHVVVCACGDMGTGRPPARMQAIYELPAGARFAGDVTVAYPARLYELVPSRTDARGRACHPPR